MSLTINRDDIKKGIGNPNGVIDADFIGQYYIETNENKVYIATSLGMDGWQKTLLAGDSVTVSELGDTISLIKNEVVDRIGTDFLQQPAIQVGLKGGVIDINSDTYIKGDLYLWDASYSKNPDKTWNSRSREYSITNNQTFNLTDADHNATAQYISDDDKCVIKIQLPQDDGTQISAFKATARVKKENGKNNIIFRLIKNQYVIDQKEFHTVNDEEGEVFEYDFSGAQKGTVLEITTNECFASSGILSMMNPTDNNKVWTQRNWSPSLIIKNADEVDRMDVNESRFMLIQKSEKLDLEAGEYEPVPPLNGMYFKNIGSEGISTHYTVNGQTGQKLEVGKIYQFIGGGWNGPKSESEVPKRIKPELAIPQKNEAGQLIAPSTETDNSDLQTAIGGLLGAQTKDPIIANKDLEEHSGWGKGGAFHSWIYSAQSVEYRLNALKNICNGYTDSIQRNLDGKLTQVKESIKTEVATAVSQFSESDGNSFSKIDIQRGNSGNLSIDMVGNSGVLDINANEQLETPKLYIGHDNQIEELHINAKKLFFTGEIVNKNARQEVSLPPIKTSTSGQGYINSPTTSPALDLNHGAIARATQLVFDNAPDTPIGIFFPKVSGGTGRYTGSYNYITVRDGELRTNAVFSSALNYIKLDNRRIFFSPTEPTMAEEGDIWIEI